MPAAPLPDDWVVCERRRIGIRIRQLRHDRELTQEQVAERTGLDRKTISRAENGVYPMPLDHLLMVARALNVSLTHLVAE